MTWAVALAAAGFLIAFGKFIDDHHSSPSGWARGLIQDLLVRQFIILEKIKIPDIPIVVCRIVFITRYRLTLARIAITVLTYFCATWLVYIAIFWLARTPGDPLLWQLGLFCSCIASVTFMTVSFPIGRVAMRTLLKLTSVAQRILVPLLILFLTFAVPLVLFFVFEVVARLHDGVFANLLDAVAPRLPLGQQISAVVVMFVGLGILLEPTIPILLLGTAVGLVLAIALVARLVLLVVFDKASDPKKSPFAYFFAIMGVGLLFAKLVLESLFN